MDLDSTGKFQHDLLREIADECAVQFWILIVGDTIHLSPEVNRNRRLGPLFTDLCRYPYGPAKILANRPIRDYRYYRFSQPVRVEQRLLVQELIDTCMRDTWTEVDPVREISALVDDPDHLCNDYICLVIERIPAKIVKIPNDLVVLNEPLFKCLQIVLGQIKSFSRQYVIDNLQGGSYLSPREDSIVRLESSLEEKRPRFTPQNNLEQHYFDMALLRENHGYFLPPHVTSRDARNVREYEAFCALFGSGDDVLKIRSEPSSALKATYLSHHFFIPPFFACPPPDSKTSYNVDMPWKIPILLSSTEAPLTWVASKPKSDLSVTVQDFLCPLMLCEVVSDPTESDRWRMLVQAIAAARIGYYLEQCHMPDKPFFITAVYLKGVMTAQRYIVMQMDETGKVSIARKDYDLLKAEQRTKFLREMFNLQAKMEEMVSNLDNDKQEILVAVAAAAGKLPFLNSQKTTTKKTHTLGSAPEESHQHGAGSAFVADSEIVEHIDTMGYKLDAVVFGFKHVAMISHKSNPFDRRFLKLTDRVQEVEILKHLARIDSPSNHTIPDVQVWERSSGGFVIHTQSGGGHLTALVHLDKHLWSAAKQLVEGVAFMHQHGVAHRDIKPSNIVIPPHGGRLSIIDYSVAVFVRDSGRKSRSVVGTEGYMAPEVSSGNEYDPILADRWSCGKTLEALCQRCKPSMRTAFIMNISWELMDMNPIRRPTMSEVLTRMTAFESSLSAQPPNISLTTCLVAAEVGS